MAAKIASLCFHLLGYFLLVFVFVFVFISRARVNVRACVRACVYVRAYACVCVCVSVPHFSIIMSGHGCFPPAAPSIWTSLLCSVKSIQPHCI